MSKGGVRKHQIWDGSNWNDGYIDNRSRFRVYRPDYPRAYAEGYALRYHVVWWLKTGKVHPKGTDLHHKNEVKIDDRFENLELMSHGKHTQHHCYLPEAHLIRRCRNCNKEYSLPRHRVAGRAKEGFAPQYCSLKCYHSSPKKAITGKRISEGLKKAYAEGRR